MKSSAQPNVKYHRIEYHDGYVTIEQNRTRRRVPDGYHFEDDGQYIAVSFYSHIFQHKAKGSATFVLNKETKEVARLADGNHRAAHAGET